MPFSNPLVAAAALLNLLLLLLPPIALCRAKPHHGVGHLGCSTRPNIHHPHAANYSPKQPPVLPNTPARPSSVPPPPPLATPWRHHVFLNFRGPDVCHTFTDHLYYALVGKGIKAFRDDRDLPRGENVTEAIPRAIEESKLSIVVLSRGYASSEYCLDELVKIILTMKEKGHHPFPVFYKLSPDEVVDHQSSGCYKDDFERHKKRYSYERVESWSHALTSIADISGWVLTSDMSEAEMVENIAKNMVWKVREIGRKSSVDAGGINHQSNRQFGTGKQRLMNLFISVNRADGVDVRAKIGERNNIINHHSHSPAAEKILGTDSDQPRRTTELGDQVPLDSEPAGTTVISSHDQPPSSEENITVEHHHQATAASKEAGRKEEEEDDDDDDDDKKKRRLWMSRTCSTSGCSSSNNHHTHHHHQEHDQQKLKFIKPEISPQGKKTVRIPKTVAQQLANLVQERSSTIPVWVRLVGVPVEYMNAKGLSYVASVLGKPMYMDRSTASRSKLAFAKVGVEMMLSKEGDEKDINGGVVVVVVRVFYQWKPCMCISCQGTAKKT